MLYRHSTMPSMQHAVDCNAENGFLEAERRHIAMQKAVFWKPEGIILIIRTFHGTCKVCRFMP